MARRRDMTDYVIDSDVPALHELAGLKNETEEPFFLETE